MFLVILFTWEERLKMASVPIIKCSNCGREIRGINAAKGDGWLIEEDDKFFCCCVCKEEYGNKKKKKK